MLRNTLLIARTLVGLLLLLAGVLKVLDNASLIEGVAMMTWLPDALKLLVVELLPWVEVLLGILFVAGIQLRWSGAAVTLLYMVFLVYAIYGWVTGQEGECGCFGGLGGSSFGWQMTLRNTALFTGAILVWIDALSSGWRSPWERSRRQGLG